MYTYTHYAARYLKIIQNQRGQSLIQLIVAMGLMSAMSLMFAQIQTEAIKGQNSIKLSSDLNSLSTLLTLTLQNSTTCGSNLNTTNLAFLTFDTTVGTLLNQSIDINKLTYANGTSIIESGPSTSIPGVTITKLQLNQFQELTPGTSYNALLHIEATKTSGSYIGSGVYKKDIPLSLQTSYTTSPVVKITGCSGGGAIAAAAAAGTMWYSGAAVPANTLGNDGDFYLRTNGDVHTKSGGTWGASIMSLKSTAPGPTGSTGATGAVGPAGGGVAGGGSAGYVAAWATPTTLGNGPIGDAGSGNLFLGGNVGSGKLRVDGGSSTAIYAQGGSGTTAALVGSGGVGADGVSGSSASNGAGVRGSAYAGWGVHGTGQVGMYAHGVDGGFGITGGIGILAAAAGRSLQISHEANGGYPIYVESLGTLLFTLAPDGTGWMKKLPWTTSDIRLKKNIEPLKNNLEKVLQLKGVSFNWKDQGVHENASKELGFIAQDVELMFPEIVGEGHEEKGVRYKRMNYTGLLAPMVQAFQEFYQKWIEDRSELHREIDQLKKDNVILKNENTEFKTYLCGKDPTAAFCFLGTK
jgi:hypothetical protein